MPKKQKFIQYAAPLFCLLLLAVLWPAHARADAVAVADAAAAREKNDYEAVRRILKPAAEGGDAHAQYALGFLYENGIGVTQDYAAAMKWYLKAVAQDFPAAQNAAGYFYNNSLSVKRDHKLAKSLIEKTHKGTVNSRVGGDTVRYLYPDDFEWYRIAAQQGYPAAQYAWGLVYSYGTGVKQDSTEESRKWISRAAYKGYAPAQYMMAYDYAQDSGDKVDWLKKAAAQGYAPAQESLGYIYTHYYRPDSWFESLLHLDYKARGIELMYKAAESENLDAQCWVLTAYQPPVTCPFQEPVIVTPEEVRRERNLTPEELAIDGKVTAARDEILPLCLPVLCD